MKRIGTAILFSLAMMTAISFCAFADTKIAPEDENPYRVFAGLNGKDAEALRECVYWEAGRCGCGADVLEAVVQTVFNRVLRENSYKDTVYDVIYQ